VSTRDYTILIVDDEESMRHFLGKTLRREGYAVISAADGPDALAAVQTQVPDLALVDIRMPGMDGVALMRTLRSTLPGLPVILMTAYGSVQNALHAMKYGAADYVTKPFRVDEIRAKVAATLAAEAPPPPTVRQAIPGDPPGTEGGPLPAPTAREETPSQAGATERPPRGVLAFLHERAEDRGLPAADISTGIAGLREVVRLCEVVYVDELLTLTGGNISRAAEIAGITRPNMHRKALDLGLRADDYRSRPRKENPS
jgi:DNA-binding NtrC family response regulator